MENELKPAKVGLSLGLVFAIISLVCAILVAIIPGSMLTLANNIFHGLDVTQIVKAISWASVIVGIIETFIIGFIGGWLFARVYNKIK